MVRREESCVILVEVQEPETGGTTHVGRHPIEIKEETKETFEQALSKIRPVTRKVITALRGMIHTPDEIEMEFGFNLSATAGVVVASVSTETNYKVTLWWKSEKKKAL